MVKGNIVFFGTSGIAVPFLEYLETSFKISLIVTQPDTVGGRDRKKQIIPPVKTFAQQRNIPFIQPGKLSDDEIAESIRRIQPDIGVVISYGKMIPRRIFQVPVFGTVNVHFSLLPYYRGAAPVQRSIADGNTGSGITIFEIAQKLDAGDIWAQKEFAILPDDTTETLWDRMSREGAPFLGETLRAIFDKHLEKKPQDHSLATYAPPILKEEGNIDWNLTGKELYNRWRAFTPWPGLSYICRGRNFKVTQMRTSSLTHNKKTGSVLSWDRQCLKVCCGNGTVIEILELQPEGKKPMAPYCYCMGNVLPECLS